MRARPMIVVALALLAARMASAEESPTEWFRIPGEAHVRGWDGRLLLLDREKGEPGVLDARTLVGERVIRVKGAQCLAGSVPPDEGAVSRGGTTSWIDVATGEVWSLPNNKRGYREWVAVDGGLAEEHCDEKGIVDGVVVHEMPNGRVRWEVRYPSGCTNVWSVGEDVLLWRWLNGSRTCVCDLCNARTGERRWTFKYEGATFGRGFPLAGPFISAPNDDGIHIYRRPDVPSWTGVRRPLSNIRVSANAERHVCHRVEDVHFARLQRYRTGTAPVRIRRVRCGASVPHWYRIGMSLDSAFPSAVGSRWGALWRASPTGDGGVRAHPLDPRGAATRRGGGPGPRRHRRTQSLHVARASLQMSHDQDVTCSGQKRKGDKVQCEPAPRPGGYLKAAACDIGGSRETWHRSQPWTALAGGPAQAP